MNAILDDPMGVLALWSAGLSISCTVVALGGLIYDKIKTCSKKFNSKENRGNQDAR